MLDVGDDPERDARAVRPAQRRPVDDRRIVEAAMRARHLGRRVTAGALARRRGVTPGRLLACGLARPCGPPESGCGDAWPALGLILARRPQAREWPGAVDMAQIVGGFGVPHTPIFPHFVKRDGPDCEIAKLFGAQKDRAGRDAARRDRDVRHRPSQHVLPRQPADLRDRHRQDLQGAERRAARRAELRGAVGARSRRAHPRRPASRRASTSA